MPGAIGEPQTGHRRTLYTITCGLLLMSAFSLAQSLIHHWAGAVYTLSGEILCLMAALLFTRSGRTVWATMIVCVSELICGLLLTSVYGPGFKDEAMLLFPLILVAAAVLMEWRTYTIFSAVLLMSVACAGLVLAETRGTKYHRVFNTVNILLTTVVAVGLVARNLKQGSQQALEAEREIKALSERLIHAQDAERGRLARDLHDDFGQQIAALSLGMSNLKRHIPAQHGEAHRQGELLQTRLVEFSESVRRLSHELHPEILEFSGLGAALRRYCEEFSALTGIQVACQAPGAFEGVPGPAALAAYRITQEALQNVAKHARVVEAAVSLARVDGALQLTISDSGAGMDTKTRGGSPGLGLVSIKERARLVSGTFYLESRPNQGTTLRVSIPL